MLNSDGSAVLIDLGAAGKLSAPLHEYTDVYSIDAEKICSIGLLGKFLVNN